MDNFEDKPIKFQLEFLKLVEQDLVTKYKIKARSIKFKTNTAQTDFELHKILCRTTKVARGKKSKQDREKDLGHVRKRIKRLEQEIEVQKQFKERNAAYKGLVDATIQAHASCSLTQGGSNTRKRDADFDEVAKHAQAVVDLHKRLKMTDNGEPGPTEDVNKE